MFMAIHRILFASLLICFLIQSIHGATKDRLFSELEKNSLEVTTTPSRVGDGVVLDAGKDTLNITWKVSSTSTKEAQFKIIKVKLCYAPISQVDRPWRKTHDELFKDKTCPHKIVAQPYEDKKTHSIEWTLERDIPTGTYFVRAYAVDAEDHEVGYGQSTNEKKETNLFRVQAISGRHASLDIASICFSVFSVVALLVFFVNEKRKAKIEQRK